MKAKVKTVFKGFDYMHCDDFAKYLSDMAAKGWHFKEWGAGLKFEKGEPEQAVYAVEVFLKASDDAMRPEPNTQEFAEYCESAGWKFIDAKQKFCIFKKINPDAMELFTPEERVENSRKGTVSGMAILLLVLYGISAGLRWIILFTMFEDYIFSASSFFNSAIWTAMFMGQLILLLHALGKSTLLKKKLQRGEKIYIGNCQDGKYHVSIRDIYLLILIGLLMYSLFMIEQIELIILFVGIIVSVISFAIIINKIRPERDVYILVQWAFSFVLIFSASIFIMTFLPEDDEHSALEKDGVPLTITDYRESDDVVENTSHYGDQNLFGSTETYIVYGKKDSVYYQIYKSKYTWILDTIWEEELDGKKFEVDCTDDWEAQKALRNQIGTYYVRYHDSILIFNDNEDVYLTEEQIDMILDKLELR